MWGEREGGNAPIFSLNAWLKLVYLSINLINVQLKISL